MRVTIRTASRAFVQVDTGTSIHFMTTQDREDMFRKWIPDAIKYAVEFNEVTNGDSKKYGVSRCFICNVPTEGSDVCHSCQRRHGDDI